MKLIFEHHLKRIVLVCLFLFAMVPIGKAQEFSLSGRVADIDNQPVNGASVLVKNKTASTLSATDGTFSISAEVGDVLEVTYVGYLPEEVTIENQDPITILLTPAIADLEEVMVIGYGTVRKADMTGAVSSVKAEDINNIPVSSAAQAITGKMAGVNVVTRSGAPGAPVDITVRGGSSITQSTTPLYVVDGFQMDDALMNIDLNDIESIDIMKDASATAIYGARGSNGVVLITTKSGMAGRTVASYNGFMSFERLANKIDVLSPEEYVDYQYEFLMLRNRPMDQFTRNFGGGDHTDPAFYTGAAQYIHDTYGQTTPIDWQDVVFGGQAMLQNHNASVTSGTEKTNFILTYNNVSEQGILEKNGFRKNNVRARINHKISDRLRVDFNGNFNDMRTNGGGSLQGRLRMTMMQPSTGGIRFTNQQMIDTDDFANAILLDEGAHNVVNPLILNDATTISNFDRQVMGNGGLEFDILENLTFRTAGSYRWSQGRTDFWDDGRTRDAMQNHNGTPNGYRNNEESYFYQITNTLSYQEDFGKHSINGLIGQETLNSEGINLDNTYNNFSRVNFGLDNLNGTQVYSWSSGRSINRTVSVFGRAIYNYDDRYLLTATVRADGVSKFAQGNQWGTLPSAAFAWRISEEEFMANDRIFDQLKLRLSYGVTGNSNIDNYMHVTNYLPGRYVIDNTEVASLSPGDRLGNPNLVWEKTQSTNIGVDASVLKGKINLTVDVYNNISDNLLLLVDIPRHTGYMQQFQNIGSIRNRGLEFTVNTRNIDRENFRWTTDFNLSLNRSKVLNLYGTDTDRMPPGTWLVQEGQELGLFFGYQYDGVYTTDDFIQDADGSYTLRDGVARPLAPGGTIKPGDLKYKTTNDQVDDNGNPVWTPDDRTVIGNAMPRFIGGMTNNFAYKGFDLSVFVNFVYGNDVLNLNKRDFMGPYLAYTNSFFPMANRFVLIDPATGRETNDLGRLAQLNPNQHDDDAVWSLHGRNQNAITENHDYYIEDGSFLRINTVSLGYTLPEPLLRPVGLSNARVYCTVNNPYIFTSYSGYDPEVSNSGMGFQQGIDSSAYPRTRSVVFGVNLSF